MSRLLKATFECEVITPMFLGGADGNEPELRVASIRGGLRYWLRAYMGGKGEISSESLAKQEESILGSSETGSKVSITIKSNKPETVRSETYTKDDRNRPLSNGTAYLWYSLTLGDNSKKGIKPGHVFHVVMRSRDKEALTSAADAFKLFAKYGGLGSRSRRAAGSFQINSIECSFESTSDFLSASHLPRIGNIELRMRPSFNVYHSTYSEVFKVNRDFISWREAVEYIGKTMKEFRSKHGMGVNGDYDQMKNLIRFNKAANKIDRAHFGLPLSFQFRSLKNKVKRNRANVELSGNNGENRKASPLLFSIEKIEDKFFINAIYFKSEFLPHGGRITAGRKNTNIGDSRIVSDFLTKLNNN